MNENSISKADLRELERKQADQIREVGWRIDNEGRSSKADLRELERELAEQIKEVGRRIDKIERAAGNRRLTFYGILWMLCMAVILTITRN